MPKGQEISRTFIQHINKLVPRRSVRIKNHLSPETRRRFLAALSLQRWRPRHRLQANASQLSILANALARRLKKKDASDPGSQEMLRHIQRLTYLTGLLRNILSVSGLAANELFTKEGRDLLRSDPRFAGLFPGERPKGAASVSEAEIARIYQLAARAQYQGSILHFSLPRKS